MTYTAKELFEKSMAEHAEFDKRIKRLEVVVALVAVYAVGQGGASLFGRLGIW